MHNIVKCCVILHNMIVCDESGVDMTGIDYYAALGVDDDTYSQGTNDDLLEFRRIHSEKIFDLQRYIALRNDLMAHISSL